MVEIKIIDRKCRKCGRLIVGVYEKELDHNLAMHEQFCKGKNNNK